MAVRALKGAPQLTRLLRDLEPAALRRLVGAFSPLAEGLAASDDAGALEPKDVRKRLDTLHADDLARIETEARRITRLDLPEADALHLRLAEAPGFGCGGKLEDCPGALARAAWSYAQRTALLVQVERAMQVRSYREHRIVNEAYELFTPVDLAVDALDVRDLEVALAARLDLRDGCTVEAVEVPADSHSPREVMIAVTTGGALASQRTFEKDRQVQVIQYRPAAELIVVYRPDLGRIEVCGRQWSDRRSVAQHLASRVFGQNLSARPLRQRDYDLSPFRNGLKIDVPESLQDRILSIAVTEARFALGSYDRKLTVQALAGEDIDAIARDVLRGLGSRHGRPFLCDVELLLSISLPERGTQSLRFRISNQNRSTLQAETDPRKRAVGFDLLVALGVVSSPEEARAAGGRDLIASLLELLAHESDTIGAPELREMMADTSRLTRARFLTGRQIATTMLIDDEDIGPVEGRVEPDLVGKRAAVDLEGGVPLDERGLDDVMSWTINRDYVRQAALRHLKPLVLESPPEDRGHGLYWLGDGLIGEVRRPVFLLERGTDLDALDKADRLIRASAVSTAGLVLTPTRLSLGFLGRFALMFIGDLLDPETGEADGERIATRWSEKRRSAEAATDIEFHDHGDTAELIIPNLDPLTIVGQKKILIFARLYKAAIRGTGPIKTKAILADTGYSGFPAAFKDEWNNRILGTHVIRTGQGLYCLAEGKS